MIKDAVLYTSLPKEYVGCHICSHRCKITPGKFGVCGVRENRGGKLFTHVYGEVIASHVDPIEKKPLFHFLPGTPSFSLATVGCNFQCPFCQNWQISQTSVLPSGETQGHSLTPEEAVKTAVRFGCRSISYTYTEPTIFFEYALDIARVAKDAGLANVFVTNGYMTAEALEMVRPFLDACNIDLKAFSEKFYQEMCRARLQPVLDSIKLAWDMGIWVEVTTLLVPGRNDSKEELTALARFIAGVDPDIPWHISRYHPDFRFDAAPATPIKVLKRAYALGKEQGLKFIYIGNVWGEEENTACPNCGFRVIERRGFDLVENQIRNSACPSCGQAIAGVFAATEAGE